MRMPDPKPDQESEPGGSVEFERLAEVARVAEDSGFDSVWVADDAGSVGGSPDGSESLFEAYSLLGALATRTASVGLGAFPSGPTVRSPSIVAKIVTGVDVISHGRALLTLGMDAGDPDAIERLGEELAVCRALLTEEDSSFAGRFYHLDHARNRPRPVRAGGIPLMVAADDPAVAGAVARWADGVLVGGEVADAKAMILALDQACESTARDRDAVGVIWCGAAEGGRKGLVDHLRSLADVGVSGCVLSIADGHDPGAVAAAGEAVSEVVFREGRLPAGG
jgi:alkanesulfonate monooxygenase SsuD/methylene tetrahydromethanopterin reductase-like flavin-dependent oxidoreductase (luciferase family)